MLVREFLNGGWETELAEAEGAGKDPPGRYGHAASLLVDVYPESPDPRGGEREIDLAGSLEFEDLLVRHHLDGQLGALGRAQGRMFARLKCPIHADGWRTTSLDVEI
jgi:hypothetical protein